MLRDAVRSYGEFFDVETVTLKRKNSNGKLEDFKTGACWTKDLNSFFLIYCEINGIDPDTANVTIECDGGQGKTITTMNVTTDESDRSVYVIHLHF